MKRMIAFCMLAFIAAQSTCLAAEKAADPERIFYEANAAYEKGDYAKAVQEYARITGKGFESGNLYFNIGNSFFKLGKLGLAILNYERARRFIPRDSDLKSNLGYAQGTADDPFNRAPEQNFLIRLLMVPFRSFNMTTLTVFSTAVYLIIVAMFLVFIMNPERAKKAKPALVILLVIGFYTVVAFGFKYYEEEVLTYGVVIQKEVEARYEPIDKATTFYKLREGSLVVVLKEKGGWKQIRRLDGKIAWVKDDAVEDI